MRFRRGSSHSSQMPPERDREDREEEELEEELEYSIVARATPSPVQRMRPITTSEVVPSFFATVTRYPAATSEAGPRTPHSPERRRL